MFLFNIQTDRPQHEQVITGVEFNCMEATQGAHHAIHLILSMSQPSERRTSQHYGGYGTRAWFLKTPLTTLNMLTNIHIPTHTYTQTYLNT